MSGPSDKAVEAVARVRFGEGRNHRVLSTVAADMLAAAHDPALGLDRSVCLRDVVDELRRDPGHDAQAAANRLEREFGSGA